MTVELAIARKSEENEEVEMKTDYEGGTLHTFHGMGVPRLPSKLQRQERGKHSAFYSADPSQWNDIRRYTLGNSERISDLK